MQRQRIVSLLPSATEIVWGLGFANGLVGRSHECDHPPGAARLPVCSRTRIDAGAASVDIQDQATKTLTEVLSVHDVDLDILQRLQPTHIITRDQCKACSVDLAWAQEAARGLLPGEPDIISLAPQSLEDIFDDIYRVGHALGAIFQAEDFVAHLVRRKNFVMARGHEQMHRPTVACLEWFDPLMVAGNWMPQLVRCAGGINLLGEGSDPSRSMAWEELAAADPEILLLQPRGFDLKRTLREAGSLTRHPLWSGMRAVKEGKVFAVDGNQYFNRPGPRIVDSLEMLAEIIHPGEFSFGHEDEHWCRLVSG